MTKAIIAGNGPSLKEIDYARLPIDFKVFRCNQFYFEDKYYLGKNIKATTFAQQMFFEQIYTMLILKSRDEYDVDSIFIRPYEMLNVDNINFKMMDNLATFFKHNIFIHNLYSSKYIQNIDKFLEWIKLQELYFYKHTTSGILLCAIAVAMGYKEIYLAGIDFYEGKYYAFNNNQNILKVMPDFVESTPPPPNKI